MREIKRILVANRGEIVSRVARTARANNIEIVGVYAESDARAPFLADLDDALWIGDDSVASPYLNSDVILQAAKTLGADAIHPGYGFLSENSEFARAVIDAGLVWIGPPPAAIEAMGYKTRALEIAREVGVSTLQSITLSSDLADGVAKIREAALPAPLLVKPSAGGGGKGMHRVDDLNDLDAKLAQAQREAVAAFGDGTLFVERYLEHARHVEVQIMADEHQNVIHLGTRDCSVQRRHQKIFEEAPAPFLDPALIEEMAAASVNLARHIGYVGAGTIEFLVFGNEYAFLEMNTRLQVEHPVTEEVTGLDLVELQLIAASGERLPVVQEEINLAGHSIEARVYAESPAADYLPSPGTIAFCHLPDIPGIRWESGVATGTVVGTRYDPMILKVIATAANRGSATKLLARALQAVQIVGIETNISLLVRVLDHADFQAGQISTRFVDERAILREPEVPDESDFAHAAALALHTALRNSEERTVQRFAPSSWRNLRSQHSTQEFLLQDSLVRVDYSPVRHSTERWEVLIDDQPRAVRVLAHDSDTIDLELDSRRMRATIVSIGDRALVASGRGHTVLREKPLEEASSAQIAGALTAPLPGTVVQLAVAEGDQVSAGDVLVVIEAMKMEHRIVAPEQGNVASLLVKVGDLVDYQQVVAAVTPHDETAE